MSREMRNQIRNYLIKSIQKSSQHTESNNQYYNQKEKNLNKVQEMHHQKGKSKNQILGGNSRARDQRIMMSRRVYSKASCR
jgi:hypothetical protein